MLIWIGKQVEVMMLGAGERQCSLRRLKRLNEELAQAWKSGGAAV